MSDTEMRMDQAVRIVRNPKAWNTRAEYIGQTGRVVDRDGGLLEVILDRDGERYLAFPAELEAVRS